MARSGRFFQPATFDQLVVGPAGWCQAGHPLLEPCAVEGFVCCLPLLELEHLLYLIQHMVVAYSGLMIEASNKLAVWCDPLRGGHWAETQLKQSDYRG